jgi:hypothetical protein
MSSVSYEATLDLVLGEHWVAIYKDKRNRLNIRQVSSQDAWDYDVQKGLTVTITPKPHNRCTLVKVIAGRY